MLPIIISIIADHLSYLCRAKEYGIATKHSQAGDLRNFLNLNGDVYSVGSIIAQCKDAVVLHDHRKAASRNSHDLLPNAFIAYRWEVSTKRHFTPQQAAGGQAGRDALPQHCEAGGVRRMCVHDTIYIGTMSVYVKVGAGVD